MKRFHTVVAALALLVTPAPSASGQSIAVGHLVAQGTTWPPLPLTGCVFNDEIYLDGTLFFASAEATTGRRLQLYGYNDFVDCDSVVHSFAEGSAYGESAGWFRFVRTGTDAVMDGELSFPDSPTFAVYGRCAFVPQGLGFERFLLDCTLQLTY